MAEKGNESAVQEFGDPEFLRQKTSGDPCSICNEPRGDLSPCPHCGID